MKPLINRQLGIRIRDATKDDIEKLVQLSMEAEKENPKLTHFSKSSLGRAIRYLHVAEQIEDSSLVGYFNCEKIEGVCPELEIGQVYVILPKRKQKIFLAFLTRVLDEFKPYLTFEFSISAIFGNSDFYEDLAAQSERNGFLCQTESNKIVFVVDKVGKVKKFIVDNMKLLKSHGWKYE